VIVLANITDNLNLDLLLPEFVVIGAGLAAIITELLLPPGRRAVATAATCLVGLAIAFLLLIFMPLEGVAMQVTDARDGTQLTGWSSDPFSVFCRALTAGGGMLLVLMSMGYTRRMDKGHGEFYALLMFALSGVMLVSGVSDLLTLFVCLELVTISAYILAAFKRNDLKSTEAGLKYLVIGAVSTALLLLGIAFTYGAIGSLSFEVLSRAVATDGATDALLIAGLGLIFVGLFFKIGGVPFHVWIPDVYEGAPTPVTAFLATASKGAGLILMLRLMQAAVMPALAANPETFTSWVPLLGAAAIVTLLFGTLGALPQRSIKRMLAYSSIGHAGYLLMGFAAIAQGDGDGATPLSAATPASSAILFYLMAYIVTSVTAFTVVVLVGSVMGTHESRAYHGLWKRSPFLALAMALSLLSLAGVPPLSGFFGKFLLLNAAVDKGLYTLAIVGAIGVVISLYFYLVWIKDMYFTAPEDEDEMQPIGIPPSAKTVLWIGIVGMLVMGVFMPPFYRWAHDAAQALGVLP